MSDAAVEAKTGKDWPAWFEVLDKAGAAALEHRAIVQLLSGQHNVAPWWRQMITVEYERARGLRAVHETADGYAVSISKTLGAGLSDVYAAATQPGARRKWLPPGELVISSQIQDKCVRATWNGAARLELGFYAKDPCKAQLVVQLRKLAGAAQVERERDAWKLALQRLQKLLES
jgi:hypothetical protein